MKPWHASPFFPLAALILISGSAQAQIGFFANFTAATQDRTAQANSQHWTYGPTLGAYAQLRLPLISIGGDLRGAYLNGDQLHHWNVVLGPRLELKPPGISFHPYGEFLVGWGGYRDGLYTNNTTTHIDYDVIFGIDKKLIPLIDWRLIEFTYNTYFNRDSQSGSGSKDLSTGIILRLP